MEEKLIIKIQPGEKSEYDIKGKEISFSDLERKILKRNAQRALESAARAARVSGISKMSNKKINSIIKEVRKSA
jgi:hypothetical protein